LHTVRITVICWQVLSQLLSSGVDSSTHASGQHLAEHLPMIDGGAACIEDLVVARAAGGGRVQVLYSWCSLADL
jgi:hypothetical protein